MNLLLLCQKIEIIKENLDEFQVQKPRLAPVSPKENFSTLPIEEVCQIIRESYNACCRLDPVPTLLVKSFLDVLACSITEMVNVSLLSGRIPENWKTAAVIPLSKKKLGLIWYTKISFQSVTFHSFPR